MSSSINSRRLFYLGILVAGLALLRVFSGSGDPVVTISQGTYQGRTIRRKDFLHPVDAFLGIPYALPPIGELRFARPVPVPPSDTTFPALQFGARCHGKQLLALPGGSNKASEDCLTANIFRPAGVTSGLPVAVYFHGGAFNRGSARLHDTASMVSWAEPLLVISFNYRIGALGFLNSGMAAKEGLLNLGLRDQLLLLDWVQDNIAHFGGDPNKVTLIGLSAGAHSIGHHLLHSERKFAGVVMESGGPTSRALHPYDSKLHEEQFKLFMNTVGCSDISCLRSISEPLLVNASALVFDKWNPSVRWAWQPVIDNDIIKSRSLDATWPKTPILTGFTTNEGTMYVPKDLSHSKEFDAFFTELLPHIKTKVGAYYPEQDYIEWRNVGKQYKRLEAAYGQYAYACPGRQTAQLAETVYLYHWDVNRTVMGGANHGDQMWYETMDPAVRQVSPTHDQMARLFHGYITSFIVRGDPNGLSRPLWAPYAAEGKTMVFGRGNDERAGGTNIGKAAEFINDEWALKECKFWTAQSGIYED